MVDLESLIPEDETVGFLRQRTERFCVVVFSKVVSVKVCLYRNFKGGKFGLFKKSGSKQAHLYIDA